MRFILLIVVVLFSYAASANLTDLIQAVKNDDIDLVVRILSIKDADSKPAVGINDVGEDGRPAVFFVSSPEMLMRLLELGARIYQADAALAHMPIVDHNGMNVLHVLISETAPLLFLRFPDNTENNMRRIEATGHFLMRLAVLNEYKGRPKVRLETQTDKFARLAVDFIEGGGPFIDRLRNQYVVEYLPPPEGGHRARFLRMVAQEQRLQRELERQLAHEHRVEEEQRQRQAVRMQTIFDAELAQIIPAPGEDVEHGQEYDFREERATNVDGLEGRRTVLRGPQFWIDRQALHDNSNN